MTSCTRRHPTRVSCRYEGDGESDANVNASTPDDSSYSMHSADYTDASASESNIWFNMEEPSASYHQPQAQTAHARGRSTATSETDIPTHVNLCCPSCTPQQSATCRTLFFLVVFGLDLVDLFTDWLLYADIRLTEEGLVYGPPEEATICALLAFSITGSVTFVFEAVNLWWDVFRNNPWLDTDLVSAVTIWIEDLPQISINVHIAKCREDPISVFQLAKASVVLVGLLIRIIISSVKYCNKAALREASQKTKESKRHVAYRVFIMLGLIINSACAAIVFIFTQTQRDLNGNIIFQVPETIFQDQYNDQKYFQNVSVFVHCPDFDASLPSAPTGVKTNWVRLMSINDIRNHNDLDISYKYIYEKNATHLNIALYTKKDNTGWGQPECYAMDLKTGDILTVGERTCKTNLFTTQATAVFITFSFVPPRQFFRQLIFGDIRYNVKIDQTGQCSELDDLTNVNMPTILYYRTNRRFSVNRMRYLLVDKGEPRFYRENGDDLEDITEVWKTGFWRCEFSGSIAPNLDRELPIECLN